MLFIFSIGLGETLDVDADKVHILFGGTKILQISEESSDSQSCVIPRAPDKGCPCFVLRTGNSPLSFKTFLLLLFIFDYVSSILD